MTLGATVHKVAVDISDIDRGYYAEHVLTVARHPSETEGRLMLRILAFAMHAGGHLEFGRGLSTEGEPALWEIDDTGAIRIWVELGTPNVRALRKAAGKSDHVAVLAYDENKIDRWWRSNEGEFGKISKLSVACVQDAEVEALSKMCSRSMRLSITIQDGTCWVSGGSGSVQLDLAWLKRERAKD